MANFSTLFPNLQDNLDFTVGAATGSANQIYGWAQADDTTKIPKNKLPDISLGHTYTFTTNAATEALAIAAYTTLFGNGGGTEANGAITGDVLDAGDLVIITYTGGATTQMLHLLYTGPQVTAGTNTPVDANFVNVTAGVTLTAGTNTSVGSDGTSIDLNASIAGITNINTTAATNLVLGNAGASINIDSTTFDVDASNVDFTSTGAFAVTGGANQIVSLTAGGGAGGELDLTSNGTGASAIDINSSGGIDIDSAGNVSIETANGEFAVNAFGANGNVTIGGSQATTITGGANLSLTAIASELRVAGTGITAGTDAAPAVLGVGADGRLQTVNVVTGGGAYGYATVPDTAATTLTTAQLNGVIFIGSQSQAATITIPATTANGTYIKVINNSGRADTTLSSTNSFVGTADTTLVLNDTSANFELIFTAGGWAVLSS